MKNKKIKSIKNYNLENRIIFLQNIIQKTMLSAQKYKVYDILGANELNICISSLDNIFEDINTILDHITNEDLDNDSLLGKITDIESELIIIMKNFGTDSFKDLVSLMLGENYIQEQFTDIIIADRFNIIDKLVHPINFKSIVWKFEGELNNKKKLQKNRIIEDHMISENGENLECFDLARTSKSFQTKVYGIKVCIQDFKNKKTYIISCIVDDLLLSCLNSPFIKNRLISLNDEKPTDSEFNIEYWERFISSLTLKELLVYSNAEIYIKFQGTINQLCLIKQKNGISSCKRIY